MGALRVGVLGAGAWARVAHVPGWQRDPRAHVAVICDVERDRARDLAAHLGIPEATDDWQAVVTRPDLDVIDVVTPSQTHFELAWAALEAGKHVLCEKPVAYDFRETRRAAELARKNGLKTKLGFTFRYSPGVQYAKSLIDEGFCRQALHLQRLRAELAVARSPGLRCGRSTTRRPVGPPDLVAGRLRRAVIIDIGHWWVGADYAQVVGTMRNFIPERMVRATGRMMRMNIDDGDIFIGEYANGAIGSIQTSFVTVGNYPGIEAGSTASKGAIICRLVEEFGVAETIKVATPDDVEFKELAIPARFYPAGGHPARVVAVPLLRQPDQGLHRRDRRGRRAQPGQLRRRRLGAGGDQRRRALVPRASLGRRCRWTARDGARRVRAAFPRGLAGRPSSPRTTGTARSTPPSSACTTTTSGCPTSRRRGSATPGRRRALLRPGRDAARRGSLSGPSAIDRALGQGS